MRYTVAFLGLGNCVNMDVSGNCHSKKAHKLFLHALALADMQFQVGEALAAVTTVLSKCDAPADLSVVTVIATVLVHECMFISRSEMWQHDYMVEHCPASGQCCAHKLVGSAYMTF